MELIGISKMIPGDEGVVCARTWRVSRSDGPKSATRADRHRAAAGAPGHGAQARVGGLARLEADRDRAEAQPGRQERGAAEVLGHQEVLQVPAVKPTKGELPGLKPSSLKCTFTENG